MATKRPKPAARTNRPGARKPAAPQEATVKRTEPYGTVLRRMATLVEGARHASARAVNVLMTATYWELGRRIVELEQRGLRRAGYGEEILERLSNDLSERFGRGFGRRNLFLMRSFYLAYPDIVRTVSVRSKGTGSRDRVARGDGEKVQTVSAQLAEPIKHRSAAQQLAYLDTLAEAFPLPWSHYVRLLTVEGLKARAFYETEALRNGWSVRQLDRQISTRFYERTGASRNKERMLLSGAAGNPLDAEAVVREPYLLEFLGLKDEYSESDLEEALTRHLEHFLLELGSDFAFVGRQKRLRIGKRWYRIDLLLFHRRLRCLVVIDLKVGAFDHADAGQMNLYLNFAREHWTNAEENPPVGLILCTERDDALARYALDGLGNRVLAREYRLALPKEKKLEAALEKARKAIEGRGRR